MTQPTSDAPFGVRPDPLLEPDRRTSFRLPYDDVAGFAARHLRSDDCAELGVDTIARLDSALNDRVTWCSLGGDVASLDLSTIAATHFAHGIGPSAHEAVDAPAARLCTYVHRLGLWLTERRFGEGRVACLLRHEGSELDDRRYPAGLAAELADFREARRERQELALGGDKVDPWPAFSDVASSAEELAAAARAATTPTGAYLPPHVARAVLLTDRDVCGWQAGSDDSPCPHEPGHKEPHRVRSPYGDGRWTDYDATSGLEVARSLAWSRESLEGGGRWIRGVLTYGRPEVVWVRVDEAGADPTGGWVDVIAAAGDALGSTLEAYAAARRAGHDAWPAVDSTSDPGAIMDSRYVLRPKPGGADVLAPVRDTEPTPVDTADPGLEGMPVRGPFDGIAVEVAQAIGSHPEVQGPWLPGDNLRPLIGVIRVALAGELAKRGLTDDGQLQRALAVLGTVETVKATRSRAEIAGVALEPCDEYGRRRSDAIADAQGPGGKRVAELLGEQVASGVGFDPQAIADAVVDAFDGPSRAWMDPFVRFVEADDDDVLDFDGKTAPLRLQRILEAAYGDGIAHLRGLDRGLQGDTAHTDSTPGDTDVVLDDVDVDEPASGAVRELAAELARQLGRPRDEHGHRHFDAQALTAAALRGAGLAERPAGRRMLEVDGQAIRTVDGEELVAMCSEWSWARLLVDAWHTYPTTDATAGSRALAAVLHDRFAGPTIDGHGHLWEEIAATAQEWLAAARAVRGPRAAHDGGTIPADVGWTPPLLAENAAELEARGIDIVGAPITTPLCVCGHERAMHQRLGEGVTPGECTILSSVPHHDCTGFVRALESTLLGGGEAR